MARRAVVRNNFSSGVLDPLLYAHNDIDQYPSGLKDGTNVMLLPHGGFTRRPGFRFCRKLTGLGSPEYPGRLSNFRASATAQYVLHWRDERVDVYLPTVLLGGFNDTDRITRVRTPYTNALLPGLYLSPRSQTADTQVLCHQSVPPHRLLRAALRTSNPVRTYNTETRVRIYHPDHKLLDGDEVGLSGLSAVGGVTAANLNTFFTINTVEGTSGATGLSLTGGSPALSITLPTGHDFRTSPADRIKLSDYVGFAGIPAAQINRTHTVVTTGATTVTVTLPLNAPGSGTTTGGGAGTWKAANFYEVSATAATSGADGGGTVGRSWVFHSLEEDEDRTAALTHIPQFDFEDGDSPSPQNERQRLAFDGFANGDSYKLELAVPGGSGGGTNSAQTPFLDWTTADIEENGRLIGDAFDSILQSSAVTASVVYDSAVSGGSGGSDPDHHEFTVEFAPPIAIGLIDVFKIRGSGTIDPSRDVAGGSTEEDVISTTRGWPGGCIFTKQGRLWFFDLASQKTGVMGSRSDGTYFNFDVGSGLPDDGIHETGFTDRILHMVEDRTLYALTTGGEVEMGGGDGEAITPTNIKLIQINGYGATSVVPVSVAGRPIYVDRTGRTIRQLGFSQDSGNAESKDISILSQFLIDAPVAMTLWRNGYGDYVAVAMDDGSMAVLNINVDQGVAGWTKWTTDGDFVDVCESGDILYAIIEREVEGDTVWHIEAVDFRMHTDAAVLQGDAGGATTWSGLDHLEGETVQVRVSVEDVTVLHPLTMSDAVVVSGDVSPMNGDVAIEALICEAGLAIPVPTASPMPPQTDLFTSLVRAEVDRISDAESREVYVNGYRIPDSADSIVPIQIVGWGERQTVTITMPNPQRCTIRSILMEVA